MSMWEHTFGSIKYNIKLYNFIMGKWSPYIVFMAVLRTIRLTGRYSDLSELENIAINVDFQLLIKTLNRTIKIWMASYTS